MKYRANVKKPWTFLSGLLGDAKTTSVVLGFILLLTIVFGVVYYLLDYYGDPFTYGGSIFAGILVPTLFLLGYLNGLFMDGPVQKRGGFFRHFRKGRVREYSTTYRWKFILQKLSSFGICILIFVFSMVISFVLLLPATVSVMSGVKGVVFYASIAVAFPFMLITITMPAIAFLSLAYAFDPYEPEPRGYLVVALLWGVLSCFPSFFLNNLNYLLFLEIFENEIMGGLLSAVVSAPIVEEFFKAAGFILLYRLIKDETDGVIYGVAFGGGFALLENVLYGARIIPELGGFGFAFLIGMRSFDMVGHIVGPVLIGVLIGLYKGRLRGYFIRKLGGPGTRVVLGLVFLFLVVFGYSMAVDNHMIWNGLASLAVFTLPILFMITILQYIFLIGLIIGGFLLATKSYNDSMRGKTSNGAV